MIRFNLVIGNFAIVHLFTDQIMYRVLDSTDIRTTWTLLFECMAKCTYLKVGALSFIVDYL